jgi:hypothetical protein
MRARIRLKASLQHEAQSRMNADLQHEEANEKLALAGKRAETERKNSASKAKRIARQQVARLQLRQERAACSC